MPALAMAALLGGCGYSTHSLVPPGQDSIYVENFVNQIKVTSEITDEKPYYAYVPNMETDITRSVIDRFLIDGTYELKNEKDAYCTLKGELVDYRREALRYDTNDNVSEYRLSVVVNMKLVETKTGNVIWHEERFAGEESYRTEGPYASSESVALNEAIDDLAERIVERTVENW